MVEYLAVLSRGILVLILFAAVSGKLAHKDQFIKNLQDSFSVPSGLAPQAFYFLVLLESVLCAGLVLAGNFLLSDFWLKPLFIVTTALFAAMTLLLFTMLLQHRVFTCACFGEPQHPVNWGDVIRNTVLVAGGGIGCLAEHSLINPVEQALLITAALPVALILVQLSRIFPMLTTAEAYQ